MFLIQYSMRQRIVVGNVFAFMKIESIVIFNLWWFFFFSFLNPTMKFIVKWYNQLEPFFMWHVIFQRREKIDALDTYLNMVDGKAIDSYNFFSFTLIARLYQCFFLQNFTYIWVFLHFMCEVGQTRPDERCYNHTEKP